MSRYKPAWNHEISQTRPVLKLLSLFIKMLIKSLENVHLLSLQQAPVGGDLHLQVLLDAEQLLVVGLGALHVQPQLGQVVLHLAQGGLQALHLPRVLLPRLDQVALQRRHLGGGWREAKRER